MRRAPRDDQARWESLRRRAESLLDGTGAATERPVGRSARELIQELRVAQVELEIQNEELRAAQESLESSRNRYEALFHRAPVGYVVLDGIGIIRQVNESLCQILGRSPDQFQGRSLRSLVAEDLQGVFDRRLASMLRRHEPRVIETRLRHGAENRLVDVRLEGSVAEDMPGGDGKGGLLLAVSDVTEAKSLEKQLWESQKLETVGRLAGGIAHDFNNALAVIQGTVDLARLEPQLSSALDEYLDQIEAASSRSAVLVQQLLAFARKDLAVPRVVDLAEILAPMETMLGRMLPESVQARWTVDPDVHPVRMDPVQLDQVVTNLVLNARDAVNGDGRIELRCHNVMLDESQCRGNPRAVPGDYVAITVSDNGVGMDTETRARAFEPFFTTKELGKGTGLGLATVYGIVARNRGVITVQSEAGRGAAFTVYLPAHRDAARTTQHAPRANGRLTGQETILLVEDDPQILRMTRQILARKGYDVKAFNDPQQALDWFRDHADTVDVVLSDVVMPGLSGPKLVERLRGVRADLAFMFMSGYPRDEVTSPLLADAGTSFLHKPFDSVTLLSAVRKVLDARKSNRGRAG